MKNHLYRYLRYCLIVLTFIFMTFWNYITPLWNDDEGWTRMSFILILKRGISDYFHSNGRILGQITARSLVNIPLPLEAMLNAGAFSIVAYLILKLAIRKNENDLSILLKYIFILLGIFLLTPCFSQVYLWRPGSGNYLWPMMIDLLFINAFITNKKGPLFLSLLIVLGFITGTTNENTVGGIVIICIYYLLSKKVAKIKIWPVISLLIGYAFLLLSPGDALRARTDNPNFLKLSIFGKIETNLVPVNDFIIDNLIYEVLIFVVLFSFGLFVKKNKGNIIESLVWFVAGILVWYVLILSPGAPNEPQTYYGGFVLTLVANAKLFSISRESDVTTKQVFTAILVALTFFAFVNVSNGFIDAWKTDKAIRQRNTEIIQKKNKGIKQIGVEPLSYYGKSKYAMFFWQFDLSNNPGAWQNKAVAHRYKVKEVYLKQ